MPIRFRCPACQTHYQLNDSEGGQKVECACGKRLRIPEGGSRTAATPAPPSGMISLQCSNCEKRYEVTAELAGEEVECQCGCQLQIPAVEAVPTSGENDLRVVPAAVVPAAVSPAPASAESDDAHPAPAETSIVKDEDPDQDSGSQQRQAVDEKAAAKRRSQKKQKQTWILVGSTTAILVIVVAGLYAMQSGEVPEAPAVAVSEPGGAATPDQALANSVVDPPIVTQPGKASGVRRDTSSDTPELPAPEAVEKPFDPAARKGGANEFLVAAPSSRSASENSKRAVEDVTKSPADKTKTDAGPIASQAGEKSTARNVADKGEKPDQRMSGGTETAAPAKDRILFVRPKKTYRGFDQASKAGLTLVSELAALKLKSQSGRKSDVAAWSNKLALTGGTLRVAQQEISSGTDPVMATRIRLLLAWSYLESRQYNEAGVVGQYLAVRTPQGMVIEPKKKEPETEEQKKAETPEPTSIGAKLIAAEVKKSGGGKGKAKPDSVLGSGAVIRPKREAAMMALSAYMAVYQSLSSESSGPETRESEYRRIVEVSELIDKYWPKHKKANNIRLQTAQLHAQHNAPLKAAGWYQRIAGTSVEAARATLAAGQIYYSLSRAQPTSDSNVDAANVESNRVKAQQLLQQGIKLSVDFEVLRDNLHLAKFTLAQMNLKAKKYQPAIQYLTSEPHSLLAAVSDIADDARPATGVQSVRFGTAVLECLIQSHIGQGKTAAALAAIPKLEAIVGGQVTPAVALIYARLAEELGGGTGNGQEESSGEIDLTALKAAAALLQLVAEHADQLQGVSLLKSATTATKLATTTTSEEESSQLHQIAAEIYKRLLTVSPEGSRRAIEYRMAVSLSSAGQYQQALAVFDEMLKVKPNVLDVQFESAQARMAYGVAENAIEELDAAMDGIPDAPHFWGWRKIASRLQKMVEKPTAKPRIRSLFVNACNNIAQCRLKRAALTTDTVKRKRELENGATELRVLAMRMTSDNSEEYDQLEGTYHQILASLGRPAEALFEKIGN